MKLSLILVAALFVLQGKVNAIDPVTSSASGVTGITTLSSHFNSTLTTGNSTASNSTASRSSTGNSTTGDFTATRKSTVSPDGSSSNFSNSTLNGTTTNSLISNETIIPRNASDDTTDPDLTTRRDGVSVTKIPGELDSSLVTSSENLTDSSSKPSITKNKLKLAGNFSTGLSVLGVGTIYDDTFVLQENSSNIKVYDRDFELKMTLGLSKMVTPYDMVAIGFMENLFVLDTSEASTILRIRSDRRFDSSRWLFSESNSSVSAISVTPEKYILVIDLVVPKLKEFLPNGVLIKVINLNTPTMPMHAVKVETNLYAVSFGRTPTEKHQICLFDAEGKKVGNCYGDAAGSGEGQLNTPMRLLVTDRSTILVADFGNGRIIELDSKLAYVKTLLSTSDGLHHPSRMALDRWRGLLFVGDNEVENEKIKSGKVLAYKL